MWAKIAWELRSEPGLAGYEVMSEPRNKHVAQSEVVRTEWWRGGGVGREQ